jgi:GNAT superfamily N-acetyltransferase
MNEKSFKAIKRLNLAELDSQTIENFKPFTEPKFYPCLHGHHPDNVSNTISIAIAAFADGKPVGLVLASWIPILRMTEMHSIFVLEKYRRQKIASQMLSLFEDELISNSCMVISFSYIAREPASIAIEGLLNAQKWAPPSLFMLKCLYDGFTFNPPWLNKHLPLPLGFSLFPWHQLTAKERARLQFKEGQGGFSVEVSPFGPKESLIEPLNSLGLRYHDEVVGWMITHRTAPDKIQYSALYIEKEYQLQGIAIRMLCESILIQTHSPVQWGELHINVNMVNRTWLNFIKRSLIPFADKATYINQTWKHLKK